MKNTTLRLAFSAIAIAVLLGVGGCSVTPTWDKEKNIDAGIPRLAQAFPH